MWELKSSIFGKRFTFNGSASISGSESATFKCKTCNKPFSENLDFVKERRIYICRLAKNMIGQVLENDIQSVAERNDVSPEEIEQSPRRLASGQC